MPKKENVYSITIRAHQNDIQVFEQYFATLKVFLQNYETYSYSVEWDDSINRHLHLYLITSDRDSDSLKNKLIKKDFKTILNNLNQTQTILSQFINIQKVKDTPEDKLKILGYVNKWCCRRRDSKNIPSQQIIDAVEYYTIQKHHEKTQIKDDVKIVTTKNIYAMTKQFCQDTGTRIDDPCLRLKMTQHKYGFINVTPRNISRAFKELKIMENQHTLQESFDITAEGDGADQTYDGYQHDVIIQLLDYIESVLPQEMEEVPKNIQHIAVKFHKDWY